MKTLYKVTTTQTLVFEDYIEADSLKDAQENSRRVWCDQDSYVERLSSSSSEVTQATQQEQEKYYHG